MAETASHLCERSGELALVVAIAGGTTAIAMKATAPKNSVTTKSIRPYNVTARDLTRLIEVRGQTTFNDPAPPDGTFSGATATAHCPAGTPRNHRRRICRQRPRRADWLRANQRRLGGERQGLTGPIEATDHCDRSVPLEAGRKTDSLAAHDELALARCPGLVGIAALALDQRSEDVAHPTDRLGEPIPAVETSIGPVRNCLNVRHLRPTRACSATARPSAFGPGRWPRKVAACPLVRCFFGNCKGRNHRRVELDSVADLLRVESVDEVNACAKVRRRVWWRSDHLPAS